MLQSISLLSNNRHYHSNNMAIMHSSSTVTTGSIAGCVSNSSSCLSSPSKPIIALLSSTSSKKRQRVSSTQKENILTMLRTIHPTDYTKAAFKANGCKDLDAITTQCIKRFQSTPTPQQLEAYSTDILLAVRSNNVEKARQLYADGSYNGTNACNKFQESILHIACRRGSLPMVQFLINEVGLKVNEIRDDYHRTPLHDAFWTTSASPDVIDFLLQSDPNVVELLLLKDVRGYTPLDYARSEHRSKWLHFLWQRKHILRASTSVTEDSTEEQQSQQQNKRQRILSQ
ncbi:ankyrin [Fragilariopsis cylindrus CCMP1102]|uniref:Ankyrin n=1 Tax=Fragilariopsis cylindrus CCMP1102 TaxID=635003 RepID=A0A1E7EM35_9STRA|nr:ankyrin [Fragilariopsis cylindrus CCMP1102]|eukprot:OEU06951.1 ankyrin [Fragilariopsis cylindrus CCMP1102]